MLFCNESMHSPTAMMLSGGVRSSSTVFKLGQRVKAKGSGDNFRPPTGWIETPRNDWQNSSIQNNWTSFPSKLRLENPTKTASDRHFKQYKNVDKQTRTRPGRT